MPSDKQLCGVKLHDVLEKRRLDQALNAKEFAVLTGISYSVARGWFRLPGFPVLRGVVFWGDFVEWRRNRAALGMSGQISQAAPAAISPSPQGSDLGSRAARILRVANS